MKWLQGILDRIAACTEEELKGQEPTEEIERDEKVIGVLSPELQKLHRYRGLIFDRFKATMKKHEQAHESGRHTKEDCKKFSVDMEPLKEELDLLGIVLWREVREELKCTQDSIGIRRGYKVVELSPEAVRKERFMEAIGLGGR